MSTTFLSGIKIPSVTSLPTAAANSGRVFSQGGTVWFSDGSVWIDMGQTVSVGTTAPVSPSTNDLWVDTN